ncbi:MAG: hypothetical protein ACI9G1_003210 [Pirellulaceae bacterium]|jgi:hypothetical protein
MHVPTWTRFTARVVGLAAAIGAGFGMTLCFILSGGNAAVQFYLTYGLFCATVGLIGGLLAAAILGIVRVLRRTP